MWEFLILFNDMWDESEDTALRAMMLNLNFGGLRPSTLHLDHGASYQSYHSTIQLYWDITTKA